MAVSIALGTMPALGASDTQIGVSGADGPNGTLVDNGGTIELTDGGPGEVGGPANSTASSPDPSNDSTAIGGAGGKGGDGTQSGDLVSNGGAGGAGGAASASAAQTGTITGDVTDTAIAVGGNGGNGGDGGSSFAATGIGGRGGDGGAASGSASALSSSSTSDPDNNLYSAWVTSIATGGNGGNGGAANGAGGNGGIASIGTINASSSAGAVRVDIETHGGNGGQGSGTGKGGDGASETGGVLHGTIAGTQIYLHQSAFGGNAGRSMTGAPGLAGDASSGITRNQVGFGTPQVLDVTSDATGGNGAPSSGIGSNNVASAGGTASATNLLTYSAFNLSGQATATGGSGGDLLSGNGFAGKGGASWAISDVTKPAAPPGPAPSTTAGGFASATSIGGAGGSVLGTANGNAGTGGEGQADVDLDTNVANVIPIPGSIPPNAEAVALGGAGGNATGSGNANAGAGGNAHASLDATASSGTLNHYLSSTGGDGGSVTGTGHGNGGNGGQADGLENIHYGASHLTGIFTLRGGDGGDGRGADFRAGSGSSAIFDGTMTISGTGASGAEPSSMEMNLIGGNGGFGADGAAGGSGGDADFSNDVTLQPSGPFRFTQTLIAGASGGSDGANPGANGTANSEFMKSVYGSPSLEIDTAAYGGGGDEVRNTNGNVGGDGHSALFITSVKDVSGNAFAQGGAGASINSGMSGFTAGAGGQSGTDVSITSIGSGSVHASGISAPGDGGAINTALSGTGGAGGASKATVGGTGQLDVTVTSNATGGAGGQGSGTGYFGGRGGDAEARAYATTSSAAPAVANATATGGSPGVGVNGAMPRDAGAANALAKATSLSQATASAIASGASGSATTDARINATGRVAFVDAGAVAPVNGSANAYSLAVSSESIVDDSGAMAESRAAAQPTASDVNTLWQNSANVRNGFSNDAARVDAIFTGTMRSASSGTPRIYTTSLELNENNAQLSSDAMLIGAAGAQALTGMAPDDALRFRIVRNGATLLDQTLNGTQASEYFRDSLFALGPANANLNGSNMDVKLLLDLTSTHSGDGLGLSFVAGAPGGAFGGDWHNAAGGSWTTPGNWSSNTMPIGPGASATFGNVITAPHTITLDQNTTIGSLTFNSGPGYAISPGAVASALVLDNAGAPGAINIIAGNQAIDAAVSILSPGLSVSAPTGQNLFVHAGISGPGTITKNGDGTLSINGMNVAGLNLQGGKTKFFLSAMAPARIIGSLAISSGAKLDLTDGKLIVTAPDAIGSWNGSSYTGITGLIESGRNDGSWDGSGIITSLSYARSKLTSIGVATARDLGIQDFGQVGVSPTDTIVMYTWGGDANLDGKINIDDYGLIDSHVGQSGTAFGWHNGDFNYDGKINIDDYGIIDGNIGAQGAPIPNDARALQGVSEVPEPASMALLAMGGISIIRRRRSAKFA